MAQTAAVLAILLRFAWIAGQWRCFQKMGCRGWEAAVPIYRTYLLFHELYGYGWQMLYLFLPLYNIYAYLKYHVHLARSFNQRVLFGIGLALLPFLFFPVLGFGGAVYLDGSARQTVPSAS